MFRCMKYECCKIFGNPVIGILWAILLILNIIGMTASEYKQEPGWFRNRSLAVEIEAQYAALPPEEAAEQLEEWCSHSELMAYASWSRDGAPQDEAQTQLALLLEMYPDLPALVQEIDPVYYYDTYSLYADLYSRYQWLNEYPDYLRQVQKQAEQLRTTALFSEENTFSKRNAQKNAEDFAACKQIPLQIGSNRFLTAVNRWRIADIFTLVLVLMVGFFLFLEERENDVFRLIRATPNGRTATAAAKLMTGCLFAAMIAATFAVGTMLTAGALYGAPDWERSVQSISSFRGCTLPLTEGTYLICFVLQKLVAAVLITLLIACLAAYLPSIKLVCVAGVILGATETFFYVFLHPASAGNCLKYINLLFLEDPAAVFTEYTNLNFFGYALSVRPVLYGTCLVFSLLLGGCFLNRYPLPERRPLPVLPLPAHGNRLHFPVLKTTSLFWQEIRRILVSGRGGFVWGLAFALVCVWCCQLPTVRLEYDQAVYRYYLHQVEGTLTEEHEAIIEDWNRNFASLPHQVQSLQEKLENGQITADEYKAQTVALEAFSNQQEGFQLVWLQYERVSLLNERGIQPALIDTISEEYLLGNTTRDVISYVGMLLLLLLLVLPISGEDTSLSRLVSATENGRNVWRLRIAVSALFGMALTFLKWMPVLWDMLRQYPIAEWDADIQNLQMYGNSDTRLTILQFLLFWIFSQLLASIFYSQSFLIFISVLGRASLSVPAGLLLIFLSLAAWRFPAEAAALLNPASAFFSPGTVLLDHALLSILLRGILAVVSVCCAGKIVIPGKNPKGRYKIHL